MEFRPCIDLHNGKVKQIVGGSLRDTGDSALENYVSERGAEDYAALFRQQGWKGGHVILLNHKDSPYYDATKAQAMAALQAYPGGLQVGGGIGPENAREYLEAGACAVIVTSYVFHDGKLDGDRLEKLSSAIGPEHLVLDLSCRKTAEGKYRIVTDRWQNDTDLYLEPELLTQLSIYTKEYLIHAVDVEGKANGPEVELLSLLAEYAIEGRCPVTYAGGVHSYEDISLIGHIGRGRIHVTIGSALDLYGGALEWQKVSEIIKNI